MHEVLREVKDYLKYDEGTGNFYWVKRTSNRVKVGSLAGSYSAEGYKILSLKGRKFPLHHLVWYFEYGKLPNGQLDHINGIRDDNRVANLREVDHQENQKNAKTPKNSTSGVAGVCWYETRGKYKAHIKVDYKQIHLGYFRTLSEAVNARKLAEVKYNFHPNHGRP